MYAIVLAIVVTLARLPYPLLPRQLTLISTLTIGLPGFLLSLLPTTAAPHHRLVAVALRRAVPAGVLTACGVVGAYAIVRAQWHIEITERSAALIAALICGLVVLVVASGPLDHTRRGIAAFSVICGAMAFTVPSFRAVLAIEVLAIEVPQPSALLIAIACSALAGVAIAVGWRWVDNDR